MTWNKSPMTQDDFRRSDKDRIILIRCWLTSPDQNQQPRITSMRIQCYCSRWSETQNARKIGRKRCNFLRDLDQIIISPKCQKQGK